MSTRRVVSVLGVCLVASATWVAAAPKKKGGTVAPAKDGSGSGSGTGSSAASGSATGSGGKTAPRPKVDPSSTTIGADATGSGAGSAVQMTEDAPPSDINGTDENPDAPRGTSDGVSATVTVKKRAPAVYPIEEVLRPITLTEGLTEVSLAPHFEVADDARLGYAGGDALRARFGITDKIQVGLTYGFAGIFHQPVTQTMGKAIGFHAGKAVGPDVTVQLQPWVGVRLGVPVYVQPLAVSLALGAPLKFVLGDKLAIGGMDDLLNIKISKFAPSFYSEFDNAMAATTVSTNTAQTPVRLRLSAFAIYQQDKQLALIGRFGTDTAFSSGGGGTPGTASGGGTVTFVRAGLQYALKKYLDLGGTLGFDDLAHAGTFGFAGILNVRI